MKIRSVSVNHQYAKTQGWVGHRGAGPDPGVAEELTTAETNTSLVPHPDGSGGVVWGTDGPAFATPAIVLGTAAAAGVATTTIRSDATIVAFDATTPAAIGTAATGSVAKAAHRDHVHATGAGTPTTQAFGDAAATGSGPAGAMTDHKHAMPTAAITTSGLTQATGKMLGRSTAGTGAIEEITVGTGLTLSAGSLTASGGSASDIALWRPVLDGATGAVLQDGATGEAIMAFGPA